MENITLRLSCPANDKLCFDKDLFPFVFYLEKFKKEQENILSGNSKEISLNFRLLMYLLSRNHYLFEINHIRKELSGASENKDIVNSIFEDKLSEVNNNLENYLKELIEEGYLDYIFVKE